ncbi:hypothetical protein [Macrococcoides caseolyticum]|uniref:YobI-like P-loop NTPase domain-containing protein n=1 Tax=Macrococcus caseolyticus (strain JCSC5402) TaxID=458233 RepID=B9E9N2_MACCJ|nr:hypothetical protein [Macrococcus caseolyticus]BAH16943.1 conserved hypothetical protein [Macrococcus caseolyticus JCSC5402]
MSEQKKFKFHKLTPRMVDSSHPSYKISKKALDDAYLDNDIKNIAITGIYGSGKSSFLKTYFNNEANQNNMINVSIADFEGDTKNPNKIKIAEHQIINQILYQIPSYKIPLSKFRLKDKRRWWQVFLFAFVLILFALGMFSLFNRSLLEFIFTDLLHVNKVLFYMNLTVVLSLLLPLIFASVWLSRRISFKLSKFSFKGAESELIEEDDAQLLDQEVREIVYLILASGIDTIIFEDLDRFNDIFIFIRLREINSLVNSKSDKTVRFIYVIKDDLFESKDRTKFFDLMIPIIPEVTSHNSRGKVLEIFSDIEEEELKISPKILEKISVFIDDMRLLYSIRNEYEIYSKGLEADVYSDELFALLVLKNVFPKEFEELENDRGYLYKILNKRNTLIKEYETSLNRKIKEREELKNLLVTRFSDFLAMNIPTSEIDLKTNESLGQFMYNWYRNKESSKLIYFGYNGSYYTFNNFIEVLSNKDASLKERLKQINYDDFDLKIESLDQEIKNLNVEINRRHTTKTCDLLLELDEGTLSLYFEEEKKEFKDITENHYFPLMRVLMLSGLVDENYWRYKGYFHEGYLGHNDNIFINRVLSGKSVNNDFELENPSIVITYLEDVDYRRKDIINYNLIDELINQQKGRQLFNILKVVKSNNDLEAVSYISLFNYTKLKKMVEILLNIGFDVFFDFFSNSDLPSDLRLKISGIACENQTLDFNSDFNMYVSKNGEILGLDYLENKMLILQTLERLDIKFENITNIVVQKEISQFIADKRLYIMNLDNLIKLTNELLVDQSYTDQDTLQKLFKYVFQGTNKSLQEYTNENLEEIVTQYLDRIEEKNLKASSSGKAFISMLNSNLSEDSKVRLIEAESSIISNLKDVNSIRFWAELFRKDLVKSNKENLMTYFEEIGEVSSIIGFLNKNYRVEFALNQDMYRKIINDEKTDINLFNMIRRKVTETLEEINPDVGIEKLKALTYSNLIEYNTKNLSHIIYVNDNSLVIQFIKKAKSVKNQVDIVSILIQSDILELLSVSMVEDILNESLFNDTENIRLVQSYNKKLSLFNITGATKEIRIFVFNNYFRKEDVELIIRDYKHFDLWNEFITMVNASVDLMNEVESKNKPEGFIDKAIGDENLEELAKLKILNSIILDKKFQYKWKTWIKSIESIKTISSVFDNGKPTLENQYQLSIAETLRDIGVVSIGNNKRMHFKPKKFEEIRN